MSTEPVETEEVVEEITQEGEPNESVQNTEQEPEQEAAAEEVAAEDADQEEVVVSIGDEEPPEDTHRAPDWVRELRKADREKAKRIRELEARLSQTAEKPAVTLGPKPTLEGHDYDAAKYEEALANWFERKRQVDAEIEQRRKAEEAQQQAWQEKLNTYSKAKAELKVRDYEEAEAAVMEAFSQVQQGILLDALDNPAQMVAALGASRKELARLAAIESPTKFLRELSRIEDTKLKVTPKKAPPAPERMVGGTSGRVSGTVDSTLDRLRAEAEKTNDYSKVNKYKSEKRKAA